LDWAFKKKTKGPQWPVGDDGKTVAPAYLTHIGGGPMDTGLTLSLLEAYGIPHICEYPNNGLFGKLIMGHPPSGMEVFVPETMLEDAQNILTADIIADDDHLESEEESEEEI
jgi:hypothetical protein